MIASQSYVILDTSDLEQNFFEHLQWLYIGAEIC